MATEVFKYIITSRLSLYTAKEPDGEVANFETATSSAAELMVDFQIQDNDENNIDFSEVDPFDRLEVQLDQGSGLKTIFFGEIYTKTTIGTQGLNIVRIVAHDFGRILSDKQRDGIVYNGYSNEIETTIDSDYFSDIDSEIRPMNSVSRLRLFGTTVGNQAQRNALFIGKLAGTDSHAAVIFDPSGRDTINKVWLYMKDFEDQVTIDETDVDPNDSPFYAPIYIELRRTHKTKNLVFCGFNGLPPLQSVAGSDAVYVMTNNVKDGWSEATVATYAISAGITGSHMGWTVIGAGGGDVDVINNVNNAGLGDTRSDSYCKLNINGTSNNSLGIRSADFSSLIGTFDSAERASASGRVSFAVRPNFTSLSEGDVDCKVILRDVLNTEFDGGIVRFQKDGALQVVHGRDLDGNTVTEIKSASFASATNYFFHFKFDLKKMIFELYWQHATELADPFWDFVGRFNIIDFDSFSGELPLKTSRLEILWTNDPGAGSAGTFDVGWVSGNEIGNAGVMPDIDYLTGQEEYDMDSSPGVFDEGELLISSFVATPSRTAKLERIRTSTNKVNVTGVTGLAGFFLPGGFNVTGATSGGVVLSQGFDKNNERNVHHDSFNWVQIDFSDDPIPAPDVLVGIVAYSLDLQPGGDTNLIGWGHVANSNINQGHSSNVTLISNDGGFNWVNLTDADVGSSGLFMIEFSDSWEPVTENVQFIGDYANKRLEWVNNAGARAGATNADVHRARTPDNFPLIRFSQYINPTLGGIIRSNRKMRLRDVIVEIVSTADDPLNPGNAPTVFIDFNGDGFDDETGLDIDGGSGGSSGSGYDTTDFIIDTFVIKQRSLYDALRDLADHYKAIVRMVFNTARSATVVVFERNISITDAVDVGDPLPAHQYIVSKDKVTTASSDDFAIVQDSDVGFDDADVFTVFTIKGESSQFEARFVNQALETTLGRRKEMKPEIFSKENSLENLWLYAEARNELHGIALKTGAIVVDGLFPQLADGSVDINAIIRFIDSLLDNGSDTTGSENVFKPVRISYNGKEHQTTIELTNRLINLDDAERQIRERQNLLNGIEVIDQFKLADDGTDPTVTTITVTDGFFMALIQQDGNEIDAAQSPGYRRSFAFTRSQPDQDFYTFSGFFDFGQGSILNFRNPITRIEIFDDRELGSKVGTGVDLKAPLFKWSNVSFHFTYYLARTP